MGEKIALQGCNQWLLWLQSAIVGFDPIHLSIKASPSNIHTFCKLFSREASSPYPHDDDYRQHPKDTTGHLGPDWGESARIRLLQSRSNVIPWWMNFSLLVVHPNIEWLYLMKLQPSESKRIKSANPSPLHPGLSKLITIDLRVNMTFIVDYPQWDVFCYECKYFAI